MIFFVYKTETKAIQPPEKPTKPEPTIAWPDYSGDLVVAQAPTKEEHWLYRSLWFGANNT